MQPRKLGCPSGTLKGSCFAPALPLSSPVVSSPSAHGGSFGPRRRWGWPALTHRPLWLCCVVVVMVILLLTLLHPPDSDYMGEGGGGASGGSSSGKHTHDGYDKSLLSWMYDSLFPVLREQVATPPPSPSRDGAPRDEPYRFAPNEVDDVFLRRPNWRRADNQRKTYRYVREPHTEDKSTKYEKGTFTFQDNRRLSSPPGTATEKEDEDIVRVLIMVFSNRLDAQTCSMVSSAYLSGLPIVVLGDQHTYVNFTDKHYLTVRAARNAGLRPQDVIIVLDADMFFASGPEFVRAVDRFIRFSPESEAELDVRDVRDDYGEMIAPVVFGSDYTCKFPDLVGHVHSHECSPLYLPRGLQPFDAYMQRVFAAGGDKANGGKEELTRPPPPPPHRGKKKPRYQSLAKLTSPFLNGGAHISRVWAFETLMRGFKAFTDTAVAPWANASLPGHGWTCDQSIVGELFSQLLTWEIDVDIFNEHESNRVPLESQEDTPPRWNLVAPGPHGLPLGLLGVDFANEFFFSAAYENQSSITLNDRYWRPRPRPRQSGDGNERMGHAAELRQETARLFALSLAPKKNWRKVLGDGAGVAGEAEVELMVSNMYFAPRTTANDGVEDDDDDDAAAAAAAATAKEGGGEVGANENGREGKGGTYVVRRQPVPLLNRCHIEALLRANLALHHTSQAAVLAAVSGEGDLFGTYFDACLGNGSNRWAGLAPKEETVPFFAVQPLPRSRHPNLTSIATAPLVFAVAVFAQPVGGNKDDGGIPLRQRVAASELFSFPPLIHYAGPGKAAQVPTLLPVTAWGIPLYFTAPQLDDGGSRLPKPAGGSIQDAHQAKQFLYAMPFELWGDHHRTRRAFAEVCKTHIESWLIDRNALLSGEGRG